MSVPSPKIFNFSYDAAYFVPCGSLKLFLVVVIVYAALGFLHVKAETREGPSQSSDLVIRNQSAGEGGGCKGPVFPTQKGLNNPEEALKIPKKECGPLRRFHPKP